MLPVAGKIEALNIEALAASLPNSLRPIGRNSIDRNSVLPNVKAFDWVREDDPSPPVGERLVDDGIRRFDVCRWAFVYRKEVDESSDHPRRSGIRALDKPSLRTSG
jgi:hypothetical protein